jgi:hypothetical protein
VISFGRISLINEERKRVNERGAVLFPMSNKKRGQRYPNNAYHTAFIVVGYPTFWKVLKSKVCITL